MSENKFTKQYKTQLSGELRKDFEFYMSEQEMSEAEALRTCIKSHLRNKHTTPDIQTRLRAIEIKQNEIVKLLS